MSAEPNSKANLSRDSTPTSESHLDESSHRETLGQVFEVVYEQLRRIAWAKVKNERVDHTWQPTELVHEVYLKLAKLDHIDWSDRKSILKNAAWAMRMLLIDHAREKRARKVHRAGTAIDQLQATHTPLIDKTIRADQLESLHCALERYKKISPERSAILELNKFCGFSYRAIAEHLDLSLHEVRTAVKVAMAWLRKELDFL